MGRFFSLFIILFAASAFAYNGPCRDPLVALAASSKRAPVGMGLVGARSAFAAAEPGGALYSSKIETPEQFHALAKTVQAGGEAKIVKVLVDNRDPENPQLYFINTQRNEYHYNFAREALGYRNSLEVFNRTYESDSANREFIQASLVIRGDGEKDQVLIETWNRDALNAEGIKKLHDLVKGRMGGNFKVKYHPLSESQEAKARSVDGLDFVTTQDLFKGRPYMSLNEGVARGYLKFAKVADVDEGKVKLGFTDLVIFDEVPATLGLVGGVITEKVQTPLSHVNVKSINRGTINMYLAEAREKLKQYEGKPVEIEVRADGYHIKELPAESADELIAEYFEGKRPTIGKKLTYQHKPQQDGKMVDLQEVYGRRMTREKYRETTALVGAKASNLGVVSHVLKPLEKDIEVVAPPAVAAPFSFHEAFLNQTVEVVGPRGGVYRKKLRTAIRDLLKKEDLLNPDKIHPIERVSATLEKVRELIKSAEVPDELLDEYKRLIMEDENSPIHISKVPRIRLRSSTNAEDLPGFTGAGLYDSYGVGLYKKLDDGGYDMERPKSWKKIKKKLKEKIPELYSAVWNDRAFMEREFFSINGDQHMNVRLAILSHEAFPGKTFDGEAGELGNGVAITKNIYDPTKPSRIYLNSQHFDFSVTNPPTRKELQELGLPADHQYRTEEKVVATDSDAFGRNDWRTWENETIGVSSLNEGLPVLRDDITNRKDLSEMEIRRLSQALWEINRRMAWLNGENPETFSIDSEYKLMGEDRQLYIKQARPFQ